MPYDMQLDTYKKAHLREDGAMLMAAGGKLTAVTAAPGDLAGPYPKALFVYVTPATVGPHITITPLNNADGETFALTLNERVNIIDYIRVRRVTAITAGVTVLRIDDY
jgi:hypothetical protein